MSFNIIPTPTFEKELKQLSKKYPSLKQDFAKLAEQLIHEPRLGKPIGKNCFKIRLAITSKGKGKTGGARIITYVLFSETSIYLISIYDKSEAVNIAESEIIKRIKYLD